MSVERTKLRSLIEQTIGYILFDGETVKIYNDEGELIISVAASRLYDGDGFHFDTSEHGWLFARIAPGAN